MESLRSRIIPPPPPMSLRSKFPGVVGDNNQTMTSCDGSYHGIVRPNRVAGVRQPTTSSLRVMVIGVLWAARTKQRIGNE